MALPGSHLFASKELPAAELDTFSRLSEKKIERESFVLAKLYLAWFVVMEKKREKARIRKRCHCFVY